MVSLKIFRFGSQTTQLSKTQQSTKTVETLQKLAKMQKMTDGTGFYRVKTDKSLKRYALMIKIINKLKTLCTFSLISSLGLYLVNQSNSITLPIISKADAVLLPIAGVSLLGRFGLKIPQSLVQRLADRRLEQIAMAVMQDDLMGDLAILFQ